MNIFAYPASPSAADAAGAATPVPQPHVSGPALGRVPESRKVVYILPHDVVCMYLLHAGCRRCTGCATVQVSFRQRATNYRALLRKMTYKDKASRASSPPCTSHHPVRVRGRVSGTCNFVVQFFTPRHELFCSKLYIFIGCLIFVGNFP